MIVLRCYHKYHDRIDSIDKETAIKERIKKYSLRASTYRV